MEKSRRLMIKMSSIQLKERLREKLLEKNRGRSAYFLELNFEEVCEIIDDFFEEFAFA